VYRTRTEYCSKSLLGQTVREASRPDSQRWQTHTVKSQQHTTAGLRLTNPHTVTTPPGCVCHQPIRAWWSLTEDTEERDAFMRLCMHAFAPRREGTSALTSISTSTWSSGPNAFSSSPPLTWPSVQPNIFILAVSQLKGTG
jgi:hypothetical protein